MAVRGEELDGIELFEGAGRAVVLLTLEGAVRCGEGERADAAKNFLLILAGRGSIGELIDQIFRTWPAVSAFAADDASGGRFGGFRGLREQCAGEYTEGQSELLHRLAV